MSVEAEAEPLVAEAKPVSTTRILHEVEHIRSGLEDVKTRVEALDATVSMLLESFSRVEGEAGQAKRLYTIAASIGEWKRRTCRYHRNGLCMAWRASEGSPIPSRRDEAGIERPDVSKEPLLCALCPLYEPR